MYNVEHAGFDEYKIKSNDMEAFFENRSIISNPFYKYQKVLVIKCNKYNYDLWEKYCRFEKV